MARLPDEALKFSSPTRYGGGRIRQQDHVRSFNAFPAGDGRTVESVARFKFVDVEMGHRHGYVLFLATGIGETEVHELDFVLLYHLQNVCGGQCHYISPK